MVVQTLEDRLIEQFAPLAPLLERLVDSAVAETDVTVAAKAFPTLHRVAHMRRVAGMARWAIIADGLVAAELVGELPDGYSVRSTDSDHNRGQYTFRFPGGLFTLRRAPHDDEKPEGVVMQQQFEQIVRLMDEQGAPGAEEAVRVWIRPRPDGKTTFTARDRHRHETSVTLADLLSAITPPAGAHPGAPVTPRTVVRSKVTQDTDTAKN